MWERFEMSGQDVGYETKYRMEENIWDVVRL